MARRGYRKTLTVTGSTLARCGVATKITDKLNTTGLAWDIFSNMIPNPTIAVVQQGLQAFQRSGTDYLIATDGGSPQDTCKAIGTIQCNPEFADVRNPEGLSPTRQPNVPIFAVPATAGTAAGVTTNYVITDEKQRRRFVCVDPHNIPQVAFIDTDIAGAMPLALKAATGMNALTHATKGYLTRGAWVLTDALHLKVIEVITGVLRGSVAGDAGADKAMTLNQCITGTGFSNVGLGLVHGMAYPLSAFYNMPHGVADAILLPYAMRFNAGAAREKYHDIARPMGIRVEVLSLTAARQAAVETVCQLDHDVDTPDHLHEMNVRKKDIPTLAQAALEDVCTGDNPRETSLADIVGSYQAAW